MGGSCSVPIKAGRGTIIAYDERTETTAHSAGSSEVNIQHTPTTFVIRTDSGNVGSIYARSIPPGQAVSIGSKVDIWVDMYSGMPVDFSGYMSNKMAYGDSASEIKAGRRVFRTRKGTLRGGGFIPCNAKTMMLRVLSCIAVLTMVIVTLTGMHGEFAVSASCSSCASCLWCCAYAVMLGVPIYPSEQLIDWIAMHITDER